MIVEIISFGGKLKKCMHTIHKSDKTIVWLKMDVLTLNTIENWQLASKFVGKPIFP